MVNALQLNMPVPTPICVYEEITACIPILLKDNIATTKDKMNTTAGSFALLKSMLVHATSHHYCAHNWPISNKLGSKTRFFGSHFGSHPPQKSPINMHIY